MAQGYLSLEQSEELEIIGQDCFDNLAMHSLFQEFNTNWKMHDIVYDFSQFLIKNECLTMESSTFEAHCLNSSYVKGRHLMLILSNKEASFPFKICSLLIKGQHYNRLLTESELLLPNIFEKLTCLPALELSIVSCSQQEHTDKLIPREVGKLIHLRYLNLSNLEIKKLPETLWDLYNLQTLNLYGCESLEILPQGMGKLVNLRHLLIHNRNELSNMPKGIQNLTRLRTLSEFVVGGGDVEGNQVCSLASLQNLNHLVGEVRLKGLGNVGDSVEAQRAQLYSKKNITCLWMYFTREASTSRSHIEKDGAVLEALQPPLNLEQLYIQDYGGRSFPEWMMWLTQLKYLLISDCSKCERLPALGKLPLLEALCISGMKSVKRVGSEFLGIENATTSSTSSFSFIAFPKLKDLDFIDLREWDDLDDHEITRQITIMPSLSSLYVRECPELKELPKYILHATSLKSCSIYVCPKLETLPVRRSGLNLQVAGVRKATCPVRMSSSPITTPSSARFDSPQSH